MNPLERMLKRTYRQKVKTPVKRKIRQQARRVAVTCGTCGKTYTNPLTHTCTVKTDYKKRQAAEQRRQKREAAKARRKAAAGRRKAAAAARKASAKTRSAPRPRAQQHDYRTCRDDECRRHACMAFKEGVESCPLPHQ